MTQCLLRNFDNPELCSPMNPAYIALHGHNGAGGRVASSNVPADYRGELISDSGVRDEQPEIYAKLDAYVATFRRQFLDVYDEVIASGKTDNEARIKSLYLWSKSPGTGKTTTAAAILNEYLVENFSGCLKRKMTPLQRPAYFLDVNQLQTDYNTFNRPRVPDDIAEPASRRYYMAIERAKRTDFAVLDDIGVRESTEGFRGDLHSIINARVTSKLPTVYTSNIPIDALADVFGEERLVDRIRDMTQAFHFEGGSKRGKRK